eukprot:scaffold63421_cov60-Phaeocystis_antarctica.AAC.2
MPLAAGRVGRRRRGARRDGAERGGLGRLQRGCNLAGQSRAHEVAPERLAALAAQQRLELPLEIALIARGLEPQQPGQALALAPPAVDRLLLLVAIQARGVMDMNVLRRHGGGGAGCCRRGA